MAKADENKIKVLIVEDVSFIGLIIQRILAPWAKCDFAVNGVMAIDSYTRAIGGGNPYDLICLDLLLPEMDGFEVMENIRKFENDIGIDEENRVKILVISTFNDAKTVSKARRMGCDRYISKPFNRHKILEEIAAMNLITLPEPKPES